MSNFSIDIEKYYEELSAMDRQLKGVFCIQYPIYCIHSEISEVITNQKTVHQVKRHTHQHNQNRHFFTGSSQSKWKNKAAVEIMKSKERKDNIIGNGLFVFACKHKKEKNRHHKNFHDDPS